MKHTRYFSTYLDAYNYYPDGVPSTEIALVGDASYIFISSDNTYAGTTTFFNAGMTNDQIVDTMTEAAYTTGYTSGYDGGYSYGYSYGFEEGYDDGYDEGYDEGEASAVPVTPDMQNFHFHINGDLSNLTTIVPFVMCYESEPNAGYLEYSYDEQTWEDFPAFDQSKQAAILENAFYDGTNWHNDLYIRSLADENKISFLQVYWRDTTAPCWTEPGAGATEQEWNDYYNYMATTPSWPTGYSVSLEGNVLSLMYGDQFNGQRTMTTSLPSILRWKHSSEFFVGTNSITTYADKLVMPTTLRYDYGGGAFENAFREGTVLMTAPALPATTAEQSCYYEMFWGCSNLKEAPELPATYLYDNCYKNMFGLCTSLKVVAKMPYNVTTDIGATSTTGGMYSNCSGLEIICLRGGHYSSKTVTDSQSVDWTGIDAFSGAQNIKCFAWADASLNILVYSNTSSAAWLAIPYTILVGGVSVYATVYNYTDHECSDTSLGYSINADNGELVSNEANYNAMWENIGAWCTAQITNYEADERLNP